MTVPFFNPQPMQALVGAALDQAWLSVKEAGSFILGDEVATFERAFATYCEAEHCLGVANGLDAISLILRGLEIGAGDEVIVPVNTFIATWLAVEAVGAKLVPVDCDATSGNISVAAAAQAITPRTKAIIAVHLYGYPADMDGLLDLANNRGIWLIEDAAQAHGARYRGKRIGSFGVAAAFSFYPTKNLGALGDGGAVVSSDADLIEKVRLLRNYGSAKKYHHQTTGVNSRLDELQAAFLSAKLPYLDDWNAERREIAETYDRAFAPYDDLRRPSVSNSVKPVWHLYTIQSKIRDRLMQALAEKGIAAMVHYPVPPHLQGAFEHMKLRAGCFPVSERISQETLSLPIWPGMTTSQITSVIAAVESTISAIM